MPIARYGAVLTGFVVACGAAAQPLHAQPAERLEIVAQLTSVRLSGVDETDLGVGSTVGWLLTDTLTLEAAAAFFPKGGGDLLRNGRKLHILFGPKIGWRADRGGLFAKAGLGTVRVGEGRQVGVCVLTFPPPEGCYAGQTRLAFELGGVFEIYPSRRSQVRVDIGDILTRLNPSSYRSGRNGDLAHDLRLTAGVGIRF